MPSTDPPPDDLTVYLVITAPPFEAGAVKLTVTDVEPVLVAVALVGAPGSVAAGSVDLAVTDAFPDV